MVHTVASPSYAGGHQKGDSRSRGRGGGTGQTRPIRKSGTRKGKKELPGCSDGEAIADEFAAYYKALFEIKETDEAAEAECLATLEDGAKVLQPTATRCGEDISETEVYDTCMHLPYGKSPGPDRIHAAQL